MIEKLTNILAILIKSIVVFIQWKLLNALLMQSKIIIENLQNKSKNRKE